MKPDLVILHGAIGSQKQFDQLSNLLKEHYTIHRFNFEGHGGRPSTQDYSISLFSQNLTDFISEKGIHAPFIFGYSMGGYVALHAISEGLAIQKLMTLGTKFHWTPESAKQEVKMLIPEVIETKLPKFASYQHELHSPLNWKDVMRKTADMMIRLGSNPELNPERLSKVDIPVLCSVGLKDTMVSLEETEQLSLQLNNAELFTFTDFEHPIEKVELSILVKKVVDFLS